MKFDSIQKALKHRHSGTVGVGFATVAALWYVYAAGWTPEPPLVVLAAAGCAMTAFVYWLNDKFDDDGRTG